MEEGAAHVQVFAVGAVQDGERQKVHDQAADCHDQHQVGHDDEAVVKPVDRLDYDPDRDGEQGESVDERGQHREAAEAEGAFRIRRPSGHAEADPGKRETAEVRQHVAGVGHQGQRAGEDAAHKLDSHEAAGEQRRNRDAVFVSFIAAVMVLRVAAPMIVRAIMRVGMSGVGVIVGHRRQVWRRGLKSK